MEALYAPILSLAAELRLPILDLPNSFDIHNDDLYSHQIEPSATGGLLLAHMIAEVVQQHDFSALGVSRLYTMDTSGSVAGPLSCSDNVVGWKWTITARA